MRDVEYFAYGDDLEAAAWGAPMDVALLRYHRLELVQPRRGNDPELSLVTDPDGEVPGLVFRLSPADAARAANLGVRTWERRIERVSVAVPGGRLVLASTCFLIGPAPALSVPEAYAARLRALYRSHGVNPFAVEGALAASLPRAGEGGAK